MRKRLRVAIADDEPETLEDFREAVTELGHEVVLVARTGRELVDGCRSSGPELVITDIKMPDMSGLEAAAALRHQEPIPIIVVSAYHDSALIEQSLDSQVLAYLIKPVKPAHLEAAIAIVLRRFQEFQALRNEADTLRQALEDRKTIERAKGILMSRAHLEEKDAFRRLQTLASNKNQKMIEIARAIVTADEALEPSSGD